MLKDMIDRIYKGQKGQTLVETAIILLLILSLLFGITEFGRAWFYSNALTNAVRDGARYASTHQAGASFQTEVINFTFGKITSQGIPANDYRGGVKFINVSAFSGSTGIPLTSLVAGKSVKVFVVYRINILTGSIIPYFSGEKIVSKQATMRYEGN